MAKRLSPEVEREARRLAANGHGLREIGRLLACSHHAVTNVLAREPRPPGPADWNPSRRACRVTSERRSEPGSSAGGPTPRSPARLDGRCRRFRATSLPTGAGTATGHGVRSKRLDDELDVRSVRSSNTAPW